MQPEIDPMLLTQVLSSLKDALIDPGKKKGQEFIDWVLNVYITEENLNAAIKDDLDVITLAFNHLGLSHSIVSTFMRNVFKTYWDEIEELLTDANKIYDIIKVKPECLKIISTKKGKNYINRSCKSAYRNIYDFTWNQ